MEHGMAGRIQCGPTKDPMTSRTPTTAIKRQTQTERQKETSQRHYNLTNHHNHQSPTHFQFSIRSLDIAASARATKQNQTQRNKTKSEWEKGIEERERERDREKTTTTTKKKKGKRKKKRNRNQIPDWIGGISWLKSPVCHWWANGALDSPLLPPFPIKSHGFSHVMRTASLSFLLLLLLLWLHITLSMIAQTRPIRIQSAVSCPKNQTSSNLQSRQLNRLIKTRPD